MVAPLAAGAVVAGVAALYGYSKGKSDGIEEGKKKKEEELSQEVKKEIKEELRQEAKEEFDQEQSWEAHQEAAQKSPPVKRGDEVTLGVHEVKKHHSGVETAVCKKEGFVIFVEEIPDSVNEGDVISAKVTSFNDGKTSADAIYKNRN